MIAKVLQETTAITTRAGRVVIRKYPLGFKEWLYLALYDEGGKRRALPWEEYREIIAQVIARCVVEWEVPAEGGGVVPISISSAMELTEVAPDVAEAILEGVLAFNSVPPPSSGG